MDPAVPPPPASAPHPWKRRPLQGLGAAERAALVEAQVRAARPIVSGVIGGAALIMALVGGCEATGETAGIGYPW
ncbi:MAG: hypothetical protein ACTHKZ_02095 [Lysobacteraceae bacterium]